VLTPEGAVKKDIKDFLQEVQAYQFMPVQRGYGKRTVDFLVCYSGWFVGIEAKRRKGSAEAFQKRILKEIQDAGGIAFVADDIDVVRRVFDVLRQFPRRAGVRP